MSIVRIAGKVRPTRGELLKLKRRLEILQEGLEVITMKRDQLSKNLQLVVKNVSGERMELEEKLREVYRALISAYMAVGSSEIEMQATSVQGMLKVKVLPRSIMGTLVPKIEVSSRPELKGKLGMIEYGVARRFCGLIDELLRVAEMEDEVVRIVDELHKTNRKVNALEKIVIPNLRSEIKYIDDMLEDESLDEFVRAKILREIVVRRRS